MNVLMQSRFRSGMTDAEKITMKLADVQDTLAKKAHDEWEALGKDD